MNNLLNEIKMLNERLKHLQNKYKINENKLDSLYKNNIDLKKELSKIEVRITNLENKRKDLEAFPIKLKKSKQEIYKYMIITFVISTLLTLFIQIPLTLKDVLINLCAILCATLIAGSFGLSKYNSLKSQGEYIDSDIKELTDELEEETSKKKSLQKQNTNNFKLINALNVEQNDISASIKQINETLSKLDGKSLNEADKVVSLEENITPKQNSNQKTIGQKKL